MSHELYDERFFQSQSSTSQRSAAEVVPLVLEYIHPAGVLDMGSGLGTWLVEFRKTGVNTIQGVALHRLSSRISLFNSRIFRKWI
jgi:hypothetical protein